jgi:hypothetical protein
VPSGVEASFGVRAWAMAVCAGGVAVAVRRAVSLFICSVACCNDSLLDTCHTYVSNG